MSGERAEMKGRKIYVHIGCHKTGTTSIQHNLAQNPDALKAVGLHFFYENRQTGQLLLPDLHSWLEFVDPQRVVPHGLRLADPVGLRDRLAETEGDIVVSSENFAFFFEQRYIDELRESLSPVFEEIRIVCYLRRQDRHVLSHHQEGSKLFRPSEYDLFGHSPRAIPPFDARHELYLDYHRRLSMWGDVFGDKQVILKVYDRKLLREGDVVADFFEILGVDGYHKARDRNVSVGFLDAKLGHLINGVELKGRQSLVHALEVAGKGDRKMLPARAVARAYYDRFVESNRRLNRRFGISAAESLFEEDFADYPDEEQDVWTEESANAALVQLLRAFESTRPERLIEELREIALAAGDSRPDLAVRLLQLALKFKPEGPLLRRKLAEFSERMRRTPDD